MKNAIYIFTFLLFVIPTSNVFACDGHSKKINTDQENCDFNTQGSCEKSCCNSKSSQDNDCDGSCNNSNCHCPTSLNIPTPIQQFAIVFIPNFKEIKIDWNYVQSGGKPVYLSIWQPPKIS